MLRLLALALLLAPFDAHAKARPAKLLKQLDTAPDELKPELIRALGRVGRSKDVIPLVQRLDFERGDPRVNTALVETLGRLGDDRAADALLSGWDFLLDARFRSGILPAQLAVMQAAVAEALGLLGSEKVLGALRRGVFEEDSTVRCRAIEALGRRKDKTSIPKLLELLGSKDPDTAQTAFEALGVIGEKSAADAIHAAMNTDDPLVRVHAAYALALLGEKGGQLRLEGAIEEGPPSKTTLLAAYYLIKLRSTAGLDHLVKLLKDPNTPLHAQAISALGKAGDQRAVLPLIETSTGADPINRMLISRALGQLGGSRAEAALKRALRDDDPAVRSASRIALIDLGEYDD